MKIRQYIEMKTSMSNESDCIYEKLWTKDFIFICITELSIFISSHMLVSTFPFFIKDIGGNEIIIGIVSGLFFGMALFSRPFAGWILDNYNRRILLLISSIGLAVVIFSYVFVRILTIVILLRLIHGILWSSSTTAANTNAFDIIPRSRTNEGIGYFGITTSLSMVVGPFTGLFVMNYWGFAALFSISSALCIVAYFLAQQLHYKQIVRKENKSENADRINIMQHLYNGDALPAAVVLLFSCIPYGAISTFIALFASEKSVGNGGIFFACMAGASVSVRIFCGKLADQYGEGPMIYIGSICYMISLFLIAALNNSISFYIAAGFFGCGFGIIIPAMKAMAVSITPPERRGSAASTYLCAFDIGMGFGGIVAGYIISSFGYSFMFLSMCIWPAISVAVYWLWASKSPSAFKNVSKV